MKDTFDKIHRQFKQECEATIAKYPEDSQWKKQSADWMNSAFSQRYMYNFTTLGRPIIQLPSDMVAIQELIWDVKPDLIIETGVAHGGSLILSAACLALIEYCEAAERGTSINPREGARRVLGIDIDIRDHNRDAIESHPLASKIDLIQGSSIAPETVSQVKQVAEKFDRVMVFLDSNHTHEHVLEELTAYAPLVSVGSYCVVFDTIVEDLPAGTFPDRPWGPGDNPKTAVHAYLKTHPEFEIDAQIDNKLVLSVAPHGYLRRIR